MIEERVVDKTLMLRHEEALLDKEIKEGGWTVREHPLIKYRIILSRPVG